VFLCTTGIPLVRYEILDWDSNFFEVKVARITQPRLGAQPLAEVISELRKDNVRLAYWPSLEEFDSEFIEQYGGFLADRKTTFAMNFQSIDFDRVISTDIVEPFTESMCMADLERLAVQSGEHSRFASDPNIPREKFIALYTSWIKESVRKTIASEVLVILDSEKITGMITLGEKNGRGDIGLIAVDSEYRGRSYGEKLVRAAQKWFIARGYDQGQVVTQGTNIPACNLYRKCGYSIEHIAYFYHFWL